LEALGIKPFDVIRLFEIPDVDEEEVFLGFHGTGLVGE
jgi:hypothetical protein